MVFANAINSGYTYGRANDGIVTIQPDEVKLLIPKRFGGGSLKAHYNCMGALEFKDPEGTGDYLILYLDLLVALFNIDCIDKDTLTGRREQATYLKLVDLKEDLEKFTTSLKDPQNKTKEEELLFISYLKRLDYEEGLVDIEAGCSLGIGLLYKPCDRIHGEYIDVSGYLPYPLRLVSLGCGSDYDKYAGTFSGLARFSIKDEEGNFKYTSKVSVADRLCAERLVCQHKLYGYPLETLDLYKSQRKSLLGSADWVYPQVVAKEIVNYIIDLKVTNYNVPTGWGGYKVDRHQLEFATLSEAKAYALHLYNASGLVIEKGFLGCMYSGLKDVEKIGYWNDHLGCFTWK